ncbi:MAG: maleylpyruvate isomerase N-terminal domain-containing protein [Chloroflexota bacterium]|nr:maleylpyruvate isomerase N-terminal domain-containing protein [Chloroflexota bacterium]MDE2969125.1 maleylpyruvate isomerase N-terminal domain-containing protein [Chloroflexota bacterium]
MYKDALFRRIESAWGELQDALSGLSDEQMQEPGAVGEWSVRDLMAHVTTWEEEALKALPVIIVGGKLPRYASVGGIDAFNARQQEAKRHLSLDRLRLEMDATHQRLLGVLDRTAESVYAKEGRFLRRLRLDTYGHWRLHAADVRRWRKSWGL